MHIVWLYKEDWTIFQMLGCQALALPTTQQIVVDTKIDVYMQK